MTQPKKTDPLTVEEVANAADIFFPLFEAVRSRLPEGSTTEDAIKLSESVFTFAHKLRAKQDTSEAFTPFGFNKEKS